MSDREASNPPLAKSRNELGRKALGLIAICALALMACTEKPPTGVELPSAGGRYTRTVQRIFDRSCVASGCHGPGESGAGLELTSWEKVVRGSRYGEILIAFRPAESHLLDHLTGVAEPRMPLSRDPLPAGDIELLRDWVAGGARNDAGEAPYARSRRKIYVTNQGSDKVSVIDADAMVVSRIMTVDATTAVDSPHNVHVDRAGRYGYVTLINSGILLKFDVAADSVVGSAEVGAAPAHPMTSPDGGTVYVTLWDPIRPALRVLDTATMSEKYVLYFPPALGAQPHGIAITEDGSTIYTVHEGGDCLFQTRVGETAEDARLTYIPLGSPGQRLKPLQVVLDAEERHAFVTCSAGGDVRVVDTERGEMIQSIPIGGNPASEGRSPDGRTVYVANWDGNGIVGIDTRTLSVVSRLSNADLANPVFAHPHAAAVSTDGRHVFVTSENTNGIYPQHHATQEGGSNGNVAVIEIATRRVVKVLEVEVYPTGIVFMEP